jgi:hypothetical protein
VKRKIALGATALALFFCFFIIGSCEKKAETPAAGIKMIDSTDGADKWIGNWEITLINTRRCNAKLVPGESKQTINIVQNEKGLQVEGPNRIFKEIPVPLKSVLEIVDSSYTSGGARSFYTIDKINIRDGGGNCAALRWYNMLARISKSGDMMQGIVYQGFTIPKKSVCSEEVRKNYGPDCLSIFDIDGSPLQAGPQMAVPDEGPAPPPVTTTQ